VLGVDRRFAFLVIDRRRQQRLQHTRFYVPIGRLIAKGLKAIV
jgi:hypothetical protein